MNGWGIGIHLQTEEGLTMHEHEQSRAWISKVARLFSLGTFLVLFASGCGSGKTPMAVRIGYEAILPDYAFFVAKERGFFEEEGLEVEVIQFNTTNEQTLALMAGEVDMIPNSSLALLLSADVEQPGRFRVFMANGNIGNKVLVRADSPVISIEELSGATIGTLPGTTMLTYAELALAPYFENWEPPVLIGMAPPSLIEALATEQVDAILPIEPIATIALNEGVAKEILNNPLGNIMTPFTGGASALRTGLVEENPEAAAAIVRAMSRAVDFIRENDEDPRTILAQYTGFPAELLLTADLGYTWKLEEIDRDAVQALADILVEEGVVEQRVDTSRWYYHSSQ
jgi:ABC-type nitrate/sulfonate/bicarbonate transport system substrate-binding protein